VLCHVLLCCDVVYCTVLCCDMVCCADIAQLQQLDGSFAGDKWGEIDTRCAHSLSGGPPMLPVS
jgi:prenyltransferase beta subunit